MKILYVSKSSHFDDTIKNNLKSIAEEDSIIFFYSYSSAEEFINNYIVAKHASLDIIIVENNVNDFSAIDFNQRIKSDMQRTYSKGDFNFHAIPILLIVDKKENKNAFTHFGFSDVVTDIGRDNLSKYVEDIIKIVRHWRSKVLDELENLGIKFNSGKINYQYYLSRKKENLLTPISYPKIFNLFLVNLTTTGYISMSFKLKKP